MPKEIDIFPREPLVFRAQQEARFAGPRVYAINQTPAATRRAHRDRDAIGARVTLHSAKRLWVDEVRSGSSYNSSSDLRLHFGLGPETTLTALEIRWPNGQTETFPIPPLDVIATLTEGNGRTEGNGHTSPK